MLENVNKRPSSGESEKDCVILGCWDHEKTPYLIKDLELSVNLVEKKCKKLLQQLLFYKKYSDGLKTLNFETCFKNIKSNTQKKLQNQQYVSGSLPDVTVRKRILNSQQLEEIFQEKFKGKLRTINEELTLAADKIGLKEKMIFFPTEEYLKSLNDTVTCEMEDSLPKIKEDFIKMNFIKTTAKSDPMISRKALNSEFSKITQDELELYQKLSRMSLSKGQKHFGKSKVRKSRLSPIRRSALKFQKLRTKVLKRKVKRRNSLEDTSQSKNESSKSGCKDNTNKTKTIKMSKISKKHLKVSKEKKKKKFPFHNKIYRNHLSHSTVMTNGNSSQTLSEKCSPLKEEKSYSEIERMCNSLMEAIHNNDLVKESEKQSETTAEDKASLRSPLIKRPIPFTPCTSTSKSFNIGMNIQQFLSLKKYKKIHKQPSSPILAKTPENQGGQQVERKVLHYKQFDNNQNSKPESKYGVTATYPWNAERTNSTDFQRQELSHLEHKENFWMSNVTGSSNGRKVRSKFTGNSPQGYVEYHKSTMRRYTNGQESMIKSESKSAYAVGSKIMVSDCRKTDFYKLEENHNYCENACGDNYCNERSTKLRSEWSKVYDTFLNLNRRYNSLKEEITFNKLTPSELKALEDEIDYAVEKYKEFFMFYSKFLHLKNELKLLKIACETGHKPVTSFSSNCQKILCFKPTSSMAFKKALRQVQILQDNIRRLDNY